MNILFSKGQIRFVETSDPRTQGLDAEPGALFFFIGGPSTYTLQKSASIDNKSWAEATASAGVLSGSNPVGVTYVSLGGIQFLQGTGEPVSVDAPVGSFYYHTAGVQLYIKYGAAAGQWSRMHNDNIANPLFHGATIFNGAPFVLDTGFVPSGFLAPAALTGDVTDWDPTGNSTLTRYSDIYVTSDASRVINSMVRTAYRQMVRIWNKNALASARTITLTNEHAGTATVARRFACVGNANRVIQPGGFAEVAAEAVVMDRWCVGQ